MGKCPFCKDDVLERKTIKETYTYKDHSDLVDLSSGVNILPNPLNSFWENITLIPKSLKKLGR